MIVESLLPTRRSTWFTLLCRMKECCSIIGYLPSPSLLCVLRLLRISRCAIWRA
jgi:hypothetical protein